MFVTAVLVLAILAVSFADISENVEKSFYEHIVKYNLKFGDGKEFVKRLSIFAENLKTIEEHNAAGHSWKMGQNKFSHLTFDEFKDEVRIGGYRPPMLRKSGDKVHEAPADMSSVPKSVDWRNEGAVTPVKDQGQCGSCWSFSTTGALEGAYKIKNGNLKSFSEQELVSCDTGNGDMGCNGGLMDYAFEFVKKNGGLTTEDAYPYTSGTSGQSGTCKTSGYTNDPKVAPSGYTDVKPNDMDAMMSAVAQQPVSIAIQANQPAFQMYSGGVMTGTCGQRLDHGVLAVGYGTEGGVDYWLVKNSWSDSWGENGYIKIEKSSANKCGVLSQPSYPIL